MSIYANFDLRLWCDNNNLVHKRRFPDYYSGDNKTEAFRKARNDGWKINIKNDVAICPECNDKAVKQASKELK
jgi:5-methylcytosine-specific restriction endonuclease McrA